MIIPPRNAISVPERSKLGADRSALWLLAPAGLAGLSWRLMASVFAADARGAVEHIIGRLAPLRREPFCERGN